MNYSIDWDGPGERDSDNGMTDERMAFKAGWRTNAVGPETHSAEYLDGCEEVDWQEYLRNGLGPYLNSLLASEA